MKQRTAQITELSLHHLFTLLDYHFRGNVQCALFKCHRSTSFTITIINIIITMAIMHIYGRPLYFATVLFWNVILGDQQIKTRPNSATRSKIRQI